MTKTIYKYPIITIILFLTFFSILNIISIIRSENISLIILRKEKKYEKSFWFEKVSAQVLD